MKYLFTMSIERSYLAINPSLSICWSPACSGGGKTLQLYSLFYQTVSACTLCPKIIKVYNTELVSLTIHFPKVYLVLALLG